MQDNNVVSGATDNVAPKGHKSRKGSRLNAFRHGLYVQDPAIQTEYYSESEEDFRNLLEDLRNRFAPQGAFEEGLIKRLAYDAYSLKRAELYESATVRYNETTRIHQLEEELGIVALKKEIQAANERIQICKLDLEKISRVPEDIAQAAESDLEKYAAGLDVINNVLAQRMTIARLLTLNRAIRLHRLHFFFREHFEGTPTELYQLVLQRKSSEMQEEVSALARLNAVLRLNRRKLKKLMSQDYSRCLLPAKEDQETLERFYSMHTHKMAKTFDLLTKAQLARLMVAKCLLANGHGSEPNPEAPSGSFIDMPLIPSAATVAQQSITREGEEHVGQ